ncbi:hypothetical protein [Streptomyces aurantiogriseus]|uniref:hypothetical protein n=1 Tax=Streptomyces aurantiogriseus TaxID=66870 RepID=UPI001674EA87|nr:hypothetical protein [Streptomyces aurantiogriseus]
MEDAAIHNLALMLHRVAALTGTRPEELLGGISDSALTTLYLGCAQKLCAMTSGRVVDGLTARTSGVLADALPRDVRSGRKCGPLV